MSNAVPAANVIMAARAAGKVMLKLRVAVLRGLEKSRVGRIVQQERAFGAASDRTRAFELAEAWELS